MRHIAGTICGFMSGFMLYMMAGMLFIDLSSGTKPPGWTFLLFVLGWAGGHYLTVSKTKGFAKPMSRAFLIGASQWTLMFFVGLVYTAKAVAATSAKGDSVAAAAGTAIGGGIIATLSSTMSIGMAVFCAVGFFLFHFIGKEGKTAMAQDEDQKRCPDCAELVNAKAIVCKHCKHSFCEKQAV